ncbi:MAG: tRNA (adenosine(37)-N6)-threonylcarbamoyltransferase complex ATPase subunit type 1 TsaE [Bacteroidota bacterium]
MAKLFTIKVDNLEATNTFAAHLSQHLEAGDMLILNGGLGVGKTHLVKAVASALNSIDEVSSPTYTIANVYRTDKGELLHMDAYRLESHEEFWDLGLEEQFETGITMMEWGAKYASDFEDYLSLDITIDKVVETGRSITLTAVGERWQKKLPLLTESLVNLSL